MTVVDPHFTAFGRLYDYLPAALLYSQLFVYQ